MEGKEAEWENRGLNKLLLENLVKLISGIQKCSEHFVNNFLSQGTFEKNYIQFVEEGKGVLKICLFYASKSLTFKYRNEFLMIFLPLNHSLIFAHGWISAHCHLHSCIFVLSRRIMLNSSSSRVKWKGKISQMLWNGFIVCRWYFPIKIVWKLQIFSTLITFKFLPKNSEGAFFFQK